MSLGVPNKDGGRSSESGLLHSLGALLQGGILGGFTVRQNSPLGMSVLIGGVSGVHDDLIVRDPNTGAAYPVFNPDGQPIVATVTAASAVNPRKDVVVIYIDNNVTAIKTVSDNTNMVKAAVVAGVPGSSPVAPDATAIVAAINAGNPYAVIDTLTIPANSTTVTNAMVANSGQRARLPAGFVTSDALAESAAIPVKWTNPYKFNAYRNVAHNPASGVIQYDTELFDTNNNFDITTNKGRYTVPVTGYYQFNVVSSQLVTSAPQDPGMSLRKNGTTDLAYSHTVNMYNSNSSQTVNISTLIPLTAGDYVEVIGSNLALSVGSPAYNSFSGFLVSQT